MANLNTDLLSPEQAIEATVAAYNSKDAIEKINGLEASASEINDSVSKKDGVLPKNLFSNGKKIGDATSLTGWTPKIGDESKYTLIAESYFGNTSCINYQGLTSGGTALSSTISKSTSFSVLGLESVSFYVWNVDIDWLDNLSIKLETSDPLNFYYFEVYNNLSMVKSRMSILKAEWNNINILMSDFIANGAVSNTSIITNITISHTGHKFKASQLKFGDIYLNQISRPAITFSWDDGNNTDYSVGYKILKEFGYKGTSFLISSLIDKANRLSLEQIYEMMDYGWTFGCHGTGNDAWTALTLAEAEASIRDSKKFLIDNNIITDGIDCTAYPLGRFNNDIISLLNKYNITCARGTELRLNHSPVNSIMKLKLGLELKPTLAENISIFESKISKGGLVNIFYHNFIENNASYCNEQTFREFVQYIDTNYRRYVTTIPQWHKDYETGTII